MEFGYGEYVQVGTDIDGENWDHSGNAVALSGDGNTVAIGAYAEGIKKGHVRTYIWNGTHHVQKGLDVDGVTPPQQRADSIPHPESVIARTISHHHHPCLSDCSRQRVWPQANCLGRPHSRCSVPPRRLGPRRRIR